eukprot:3943212-Amphidinium_carterae.1
MVDTPYLGTHILFPRRPPPRCHFAEDAFLLYGPLRAMMLPSVLPFWRLERSIACVLGTSNIVLCAIHSEG